MKLATLTFAFASLMSASALADISVTIDGQTYSCSGNTKPQLVRTMIKCQHSSFTGPNLVVVGIMSDGSSKVVDTLKAYGDVDGSRRSWSASDIEDCEKEAARRQR